MSDLDIVLKLDPTAPVAGAKKVTDEVRKTEEQAAKTRAAVDTLSKSFAALGEAVRRQAETTWRNTSTALNHTAKAFDSVTEAIRREQAVLEAIHGPTRRYTQDLQTLDSMLARNVISTREYADQVARLNRQIEQSPAGETKVARGADLLSSGKGGGRLDSIAAGVSSLNFKQAASGAAQGFELLNQKLHITDSLLGSAAGSALKFGAMGAQIGGPWGAAIGGVVGLAADLTGKLWDAQAEMRKLREEADKEAKAYWEAIHAAEQKKRVEEMLAPAMAEHSRLAKEIAEREETKATVMTSSADAYRHATDKARAYEAQLIKVNSALAAQIAWNAKLYGKDPTAGGGQTDDEAETTKALRGMRDATIETYAATKSYGTTLVEIEKAENSRKDRLEDLAMIASDINVSQEARNKALKEYNKLVHEGTEATKSQTAALAAQKQVLDLLTANGLVPKRFGTRGSNASPYANTPDAMAEALWQEHQFNLAMAEPPEANLEADLKAQEQGEAHQRKLIENTKKWHEELNKTAETTTVIADSLKSTATSLGSTLVDAAFGADVAWKQTLDNLLKGIMNAITQALILNALTGSVTGAKGASANGKGYGGLFGLLGFSTGGTIFPSGGGTGDSQLVAFRKAPSETVHINTPRQEMAYRRGGPEGGGGGTTVRLVSEVTGRELYNPREMLVAIGKHRGEFKRLLD